MSWGKLPTAMSELKVSMNSNVAGSGASQTTGRTRSMANIMIEQIMQDVSVSRPPDRKELFC